MNEIERLAALFAEFPGIGTRQSKRFVYFLLHKDQGYTNDLSHRISEIKKSIGQCTSCFRFFEKKASPLCDECLKNNRDNSQLIIVEKDSDMDSIKKSDSYQGRYFVLGGLVPIVEKSTPLRVRINELISRIKKSEGEIKEVILAFSLSPQGDHTDTYIREMLESLREELGFTVHSLGRGLSTGTELEYSDKETIKNALKNRQ